jgi:hypothetical protein
MANQESAESYDGDSGSPNSVRKSIMELFTPALVARRRNLPPKLVEELTFRDVIEYFVSRHPGGPSIQSGALLRMPHPRGHNIFQVFLGLDDELVLDSEGQPYGRQLIAVRLDAELSYRLQNVDLLIFR